jgi:hypothetical protein
MTHFVYRKNKQGILVCPVHPAVADLLNDRVLPFFEDKVLPMLRMLVIGGQTLRYPYEIN